MKKWILAVLAALVTTVLLSASTVMCLVIPAMSIYSRHMTGRGMGSVSFSDIAHEDKEMIKTRVKTVTVKRDGAKLRAGSGPLFTEIESVESATELVVLETYRRSEGNWYKVIRGDRGLWIDGNFVSESDLISEVEYVKDSRDETKPCHLWRELTVDVDGAVLYKDADPDSKPLAVVHRGEKYTSYSGKGDDHGTSWFKLNVDGVEGYISRKMFSVKNVYSKIEDRDFGNIKPVIYLSPSRQGGNPYKTGGTTEKKEMEAVGAILYDKLLDYDCIVYVATPKFTLSQRTREAYEFGTDIYIAIHSNATGSKRIAYGANAYYFPGCAQSREYAESVIESLNKVTVFGHEDKQIHDGMAFTDNYGYAEVRDPGNLGMISILVETEYHDNADSAQWIIDHHEVLADALLESIVRTCKLEKKDISQTDISDTDE